jgi:hypothetical protein
MSFRVSQAVQDHAAQFELISNRENWFNYYWDYYETDTDPEQDKMEKDHAIIHATLQLLAESQQLRVKRVMEFIGNTDDCIYRNEIQILDQNKQVVETLVESIDESYLHNTSQDSIRVRLELVPNTSHPEVAQVELVLPMKFPNRPEFQDEHGTCIDCYYPKYNNSFYAVRITMDTEFITDSLVTEEMREERKAYRRSMQRCNTIKEDLMINRWHPTRVERLLLAGYDVEDM